MLSIVLFALVAAGFSIDINANFKAMMFVATLISLAFVVQFIVFTSRGVSSYNLSYYNWYRISSIALNGMVYILSSVIIWYKQRRWPWQTSDSSSPEARSIATLAELISRFKYYAVCQVVTRLGGKW